MKHTKHFFLKMYLLLKSIFWKRIPYSTDEKSPNNKICYANFLNTFYWGFQNIFPRIRRIFCIFSDFLEYANISSLIDFIQVMIKYGKIILLKILCRIFIIIFYKFIWTQIMYLQWIFINIVLQWSPFLVLTIQSSH